MAENAEMNWYVVHTYSGYENKVKANLEKTVENNGLQDLIAEVQIPIEEVVEIKNNKRRESHVRTAKVLGMGLFAYQGRIHLYQGVTHYDTFSPAVCKV